MKERSRTEFSMLNSITGVGGYFLNSVVGFVCRMIFVRCLADDYLGINGLFTNILSMLSLAELGIGASIAYALYKPLANKDNDKIASLMQLFKKAYIIIGCVVFALGIAVLPFLKYIIPEAPAIKEDINLIYILFLFQTAVSYFFSYRSTLLTASQRHYLVTGINYLFTIIQSALQITFLLLTKEYLIYLIINVVGAVGYNIVISAVATKIFPVIKTKGKPLEKEDKKVLARNIKALTVNRLAGVLVNNVDNIIITYFDGLATVGYASNYLLFSTTLNSLISSMFSGLTASVGNFNVTETNERKVRLFDSLNLTNFWIFGWCSIGIFVVSSDMVQLLYGERFVLHWSIPLILAVNFYMVGMQNAVWTFKSALGLFPYGQYLLFLTAALNLGLSILLGNLWGLFGIYLATAIARLFTNTWYDPYAVFKYGLHKSPMYYFIRYIKYLLILCFTGAGCWVLCSLFHFHIAVNVLIKILICSFIPNGVFWFLFHKKDEFNYIKKLIKSIVGKIKGLFSAFVKKFKKGKAND